MRYIDTHTHIFVEEFDGDRDAVMARCAESCVEKMILPAIDSGSHVRLLECCAKYDACLPALGLHPTSVDKRFEEELAVVKELLGANDAVAVGEIGLDLYWSREFFEEQITALHRQIEWALDAGKPVILHTRDAFDEMESELARYKGSRLRALFHAYSSDLARCERLMKLDIDLLFGIGGVVTYKKPVLSEVVEGLGLDKIVLETDSPYLAPVPYRGKRNESSYLPIIAGRIADIKGLSGAEVAERTTVNAKEFFRI